MNRAEEDYIKTIYELTVERKQELVKTNDLSDRFGFTDQTVNEMVKKLVSKKLVSFYPYKGINLTTKGKAIAIAMVRAHRIWEVFLTEKLGFSWEEVHDAAEKLEHATDHDVLVRLYDYLGQPTYCQHGNPIPDFKGQSASSYHLSLYDMPPGAFFEIKRVLDLKELLTYLNAEGIALHDKVSVLEKDPFNEVIKIDLNGKTKTLSGKTARMLFGIKVS